MTGGDGNKSYSLRGPRWPTFGLIILLVCLDSSLLAENLTFDHDATGFDFGKTHLPRWSGGALVNIDTNRTAAPTLLRFDSQGGQMQPIVFTIPDAEMIDLDDIARIADGTLAVCGRAFDHSGRGSGFFSIINAVGDHATTVRLYPYYPTSITFASDGTVWTLGIEAVDGKEVHPEHDVIRHFDSRGKVLGSFIPRSSLPSVYAALNGYLRSAPGRIGWYTGPVFGPGTQYYEFLSDGTFRRYPGVVSSKTEFVSGIALLDDGRTYVTTSDTKNHAWRVLSIGPDGQWSPLPVPDELKRAFLYGGEGDRLVFYRPHATMRFMRVEP